MMPPSSRRTQAPRTDRSPSSRWFSAAEMACISSSSASGRAAAAKCTINTLRAAKRSRRARMAFARAASPPTARPAAARWRRPSSPKTSSSTPSTRRLLDGVVISTQVEGTHQVQPHRQRHPQQLGRRAGRVGAAPPVRDEDRERAVPPRPRRRRATEIRQLHPSGERALRPDRGRRLGEEGVEPPSQLTKYRTHNYYATPPSPASASSNTVSYAFASTHTWVSSAPATHVIKQAPST